MIVRLYFVCLCFVLASCANTNNVVRLASDLPDILYKPRFVPGTEDVPLYKGFKIKKDDAFTYDSASGAIVDVTFTKKYLNKKIKHEVIDFYDQTLPQLGWKKIAYGTYHREGDVLKIKIEAQAGDAILNVNLLPQGVS